MFFTLWLLLGNRYRIICLYVITVDLVYINTKQENFSILNGATYCQYISKVTDYLLGDRGLILGTRTYFCLSQYVLRYRNNFAVNSFNCYDGVRLCLCGTAAEQFPDELILSVGGMILRKENLMSRTETCPSVTPSTTNSTDRGASLGFRSETLEAKPPVSWYGLAPCPTLNFTT
jgi:hypothetical protein